MPVAEEHRPSTFCLAVAPGVTVDRWVRTWAERLPEVDLELVPAEVGEASTLMSTRADAGLVRLPVDPDTFHAIPLYTEVTVVVVPRDHYLAAADEVTLADLADEALLWPLDDALDWAGAPAGIVTTERPATTAATVELVAAGVGVLVTPLSLARAYHRRDLTSCVVTDAPTSTVALVWPRDRYTDLVEELIGIVRGRTANSTRGRTQQAEPSARTPTDAGPTRPAASGKAGARRGGATPRTPPRRRGR